MRSSWLSWSVCMAGGSRKGGREGRLDGRRLFKMEDEGADIAVVDVDV